MGRKDWGALAIFLGLWVGALTPAHAQYNEDTMEPAEIGIKDIGEL